MNSKNQSLILCLNSFGVYKEHNGLQREKQMSINLFWGMGLSKISIISYQPEVIQQNPFSKQLYIHIIPFTYLPMSKSPQLLISNRYLYAPSQPLRQNDSVTQYKTYDKVTKRDLLLQIHARSDFVIDSLRQHKHAFIHYIFDKVEMDDGRVAYLFEPGVQATLNEAMLRIGNFNEEDALVVFKYILMAVKEVHDKQCIVQRLCLENILVCNYALFKLGHLIVQSDCPLEYWSPQRLQQKQITFQSDIYSLGVMLYKMLYGTFPFKASDPSQMLKKIKGKKFQTLQTKSPLDIVISRQVHFLVLSMLDYYQENRPDLATILNNSCFAFDIQTDLQKYVKPKGAIVPQSFHKKYLIYRPSKIVHRYGEYYSQSAYLMFNVNQKTFMTLYAPQVRMFQAQPRKVDSYYQKIKAMQKNYKRNGCQYLMRVDDIERFRQQPLIATEYSNQGNLYNYMEKRKLFKGWISEQETNVLMYLMAIALKQMKTMGITSVHTINNQRIMLHNGNIKLREPGILTPIIQKALQSNQSIDFFAPELKEKLDFVQLDKSDIWSYGITYIYLLTGEMPKTDQQNQINLSNLKTSKKNITIIGKCLDYNVKKRMELDNIKMENINEGLLHDMLIEGQPQNEKDRQRNNNDNQVDPNELLDQSDVDSNAQEIKDNKKVMFKRRKQRLFKHYNKIISQSTTSPCRLIIKSCCGLIILWVVFFGTFFINAGIGMLRTNFYRKITLQVPYNYGTSLYNMTILSTNGALISTKYSQYSYEQFTTDLRCAQNQYSPTATSELYDFANNSQSVFCLFGFIWAILVSILHIIQVHKLDLPNILLKRKRTSSNKQLYHLALINLMIPSLLFTFFYTFAFEYIVQMSPCFGLQNLDYPKFTSVQTILNGDLGKFFLHVFLTVVLWAIIMFVFAFLTLFVKRINFLMYEWTGIVPTILLMLVFTVICRVGFGQNVPIEPTWTYKINLDITTKYWGMFGFFPQILWVGVFMLNVLLDFIFWVFLKIGLTPADQEDITRVQVVKAKFEKVDTKEKDLANEKSNIYMIENAYDFERFD